MFYDNQDLNLKACELKIKELSSKAETLKLELLGDYSSLSIQLNMKIEELKNELENKLKNIDIEFIKIISDDNYGWGLKYLKNSKIGQFAVDLSKRLDNTGALGDISFAVGLGTTASGNMSFAQGNNTKAEGDFSHTEGNRTQATSEGAHAEGNNTKAEGDFSHAEGNNTVASGAGSHAEGNNTKAEGDFSHAEGINTSAKASGSHAEGINTRAEMSGDHAEGIGSIAKGGLSHAEGNYTQALESGAHAEGQNTKASGTASHAEGNGSEASGFASHAEGYSTQAIGDHSHVEGNQCIAKGHYSHSEGLATQASGEGSHSEGYKTQATNDYSHAEGFETQATGQYSHAEGQYAQASGEVSHAEGFSTQAIGENSHAEGFKSKALGNASHAEGLNTIAQNDYMHVQGMNNVGKSSETIHETGIGTSDDDRRNAFEIYKDGSLTAPELTFKNIFKRENSLITKEFNLMNYYKASRPVADPFFCSDNPEQTFCYVLKNFQLYLVPLNYKGLINCNPVSDFATEFFIYLDKRAFFKYISEVNIYGFFDPQYFSIVSKKLKDPKNNEITVKSKYTTKITFEIGIDDKNIMDAFLNPNSDYYYKKFFNLYYPNDEKYNFFENKEWLKRYNRNLRANELIDYDFRTEEALENAYKKFKDNKLPRLYLKFEFYPFFEPYPDAKNTTDIAIIFCVAKLNYIGTVRLDGDKFYFKNDYEDNYVGKNDPYILHLDV